MRRFVRKIVMPVATTATVLAAGFLSVSIAQAPSGTTQAAGVQVQNAPQVTASDLNWG